MEFIRERLVDISVICVLAGIAGRILDWYNPYMDFTGHMLPIQLVLYAAVLGLVVIRLLAGRTHNTEGEGK